jgi:hypothetical protein
MLSTGRDCEGGWAAGREGHRRLVSRPARLSMVCSALAALLGVSAASEAGGPHRGHYWRGGSVGVVVGVPLGWPYYGPGPLYDWPYTWPGRTVVVESPRTVYVERGSVPAQAPADVETGGDWWYYCHKPKGYYPYVERCPRGWEKVPPRPE